jgi:NodT family efflux transporter outer membrane factor (OMF) lipoprotein
MRPLHTQLTRATAVLVAVGMLGGCATPGNQRPPASRMSPASAGLTAETTDAAVFPDAAWWRTLGDPALDALIAQGLTGQPGLQAAAARLAAAAAGSDAVQASQGLQVGLAVELNRQRFTEHGIYPPPLAGGVYNTGLLQATGRYELDFFGRHAAALQAAVGQQQAAAAELQAARVLVAANLARGWVALARLFSLRELAERTLAQRRAQLDLTHQRVTAGLDSEVELRLAQGSLPDARQQIESLDGQIVLARHQLAALSGQPPQALDGAVPRLAALQPALLPERIGADLLGRRADVVAARWRVEAAQAQVARARADFYPDINLVGFVGFSTLGLDRLLSLGSRNFGAGPALRLPLFDGGSLRAQLGARGAEADAAVAAYNGAVLAAAHEVADAGASLQSLARQQTQQAQAAAAAEGAYGLAQQRYQAGLGSYLLVLNAETAVLAQRNNAAELKARALDAQVVLMRALGGGWRDDAPATAQR